MNAKERNIPVIIKTFSIIAIIFMTGSNVLGLGTEEFGDKPIRPQPEWPEGTTAVVQSPGRVYSSWVNGDESFYYKGDAVAFNRFLKKFAAAKAPVHRLYVIKEYGKVKDLHFNWKFHVPSGLYRSNLIREKGKNAAEIHPSVTVFLGGSRLKFEEVILPPNVAFIVSENASKDMRTRGQVEKARIWSRAKAKWLEFVEPYLEKVRRKAKDPSINYIEVRSGLISKYLPDYKIYIIETSYISFSKLFAVSIDGEILDLKSGSFQSLDPQGPFRNEAFSDFIKKQQIKVADANTAIEIGRLIEEIAFAPSRWMYLKSNTENFSIFKMWVFYNPGTYWLRDWEWYAKKEEDSWMVSRRYIGPPTSIGAPTHWKLILDDKERIIEVMH